MPSSNDDALREEIISSHKDLLFVEAVLINKKNFFVILFFLLGQNLRVQVGKFYFKTPYQTKLYKRHVKGSQKYSTTKHVTTSLFILNLLDKHTHNYVSIIKNFKIII